MEEKIVARIKENLNKRLRGTYLKCDDSFKAVKIDKSNFHDIEEKPGKVCFIDGGNLEILSASNFSLQLIRIYYNIYENNKKISSEKKEFFVLINSIYECGSIRYAIEVFGDYKLDFSVDSFDEMLRTGNSRVKVSTIGGLVRNISELRIAVEAAGKLSKGDIIVRDGSLEIKNDYEKKFFKELFRKSEEKCIAVIGLCKTNELFTDAGSSFSAEIQRISPNGKWYYHPIQEGVSDYFKADLVIVKLHEKGKYVFRADVYSGVKSDYSEIFGVLAKNSIDSVFLGYPYGLVDADSFARVSFKEGDYFRMKLLTKFGKDASLLENYLHTIDAHSILDSK